jgi:asparagine synthase (glutamine-hydrolysing)
MARIAAILNIDGAPVDEAVLRAMMDVPPYRSPEDAFLRIDGAMGLGFAPLPTQRSAHQKRQPGCLDGRLAVVMDGRLDDRDGLVSVFGPASDVDLVLRAYDRWGVECVSRLTGDFAFCVWDASRRRLFCARDHLGVKPLYYARVGNALVVSNVLGCVRRHPSVSPRLSDEAIGDFLLFGLCVDPSQTTFGDVSRLPPGHRCTWSASSGAHRVDRYWSLQPGELVRYADPREYVERFSSLFRAAVADRIRTEPVGVLMSGGLDSSSIAAVAADVRAQSSPSRGIHAFTVVYDAEARDEERRYSSIVAQSIGIGISHMNADDYEPFERWDEREWPPEPTLEAMTAVMGDLLDLASAHGGAVLTGEGGDPLLLPTSALGQFGCVPIAALAGDLWRTWRAGVIPPLGLRSMLQRRRAGFDDVPTWLADSLRVRLDARARVEEVQSRRSAGGGARSTAFNDVVDPWWTSTFEGLDPGATQRPVEVRYPFFDVRLVSFALTVPSFPWCLNKRILRAAMRGRLPESIRTRPKTPLQADPAGRRGRWSAHKATRLLEATPAVARYIDVAKFRSAVHHESLLTSESPGTWAAISLANWMRCEAGLPAVRFTP